LSIVIFVEALQNKTPRGSNKHGKKHLPRVFYPVLSSFWHDIRFIGVGCRVSAGYQHNLHVF